MISTDLDKIVSGKYLQFAKDYNISFLSTDSRKSVFNKSVLFFAIAGINHDAHTFINELYKKNVRQFIIESDNINFKKYPEGNFFLVNSAIYAIQELVSHYRQGFSFPVFGITGSNGKTIVKEWLSQMLSWKYNVVKTPKSYNSQIGVPIAIWQMQSYHNMGVIEAGISTIGEMERLEKVIKPNIGIITNIGPAHDEGFQSRKEKIIEKLKLFKNTETLISCSNDNLIQTSIREELSQINNITWGNKNNPDFFVQVEDSVIQIKKNDKSIEFRIPFKDAASIENLTHCIVSLLYLKWNGDQIQEAINDLHTISMRLEMKRGINDCYLIDDSYSNDMAGLEMATNYLVNQHQRNKKTLILSDIIQSGLSKKELYKKTASIINHISYDKIIGIGENIDECRKYLDQPFYHFLSTDDFLQNFPVDSFNNETILIKGARKFGMERIVSKLQEKVHGTVLEINLDALSHNLNVYRSHIKPETKIMVMVKAFAYGSGSIEVANLLQFHRVDYLGVAFTDEAINLRKNGISLPIMIMNPSIDSIEQVIEFRLEPEIYNLRILKEFDKLSIIKNQTINIHIKLDTGMHRLGFKEEDIEILISIMQKNPGLKVKSIFSHLAAADDMAHDAFTKKQADDYLRLAYRIESELKIDTIKHIANSAAILRFEEYQFNMVRLGIGLYGFDNTGILNPVLQSIGKLKTQVSQIIEIQKGDTIGYGRIGKADSNMKIATIAIGYADGFNRAFSNGKGFVMVNGAKAPVIGNVCMDMTMVDVTGLNVSEGDDVIIFGNQNPIESLAKAINTIPYEILTNISQRVKRVYFSE